MKLSKYAKTIGISYKIAWSHYSRGLITGAYQLPTGTIIVPDELLKKSQERSKGNRAAIYARVSSHENKSDLERQAARLREYATAKGYQIAYVEKEVGSGVNDKRKKLDALLKKDDWTILLIEHKDRLTRFGFNYLNTLLEKQEKKIDVVNVAENETGDLMQDLVAIIYSFSARMYGIRRAKRKTEKIIAELKAKD